MTKLKMIDVFLSEADLLAQALCGNWEHVGSVRTKWMYAVATPYRKSNCHDVCTTYLVKDDLQVELCVRFLVSEEISRVGPTGAAHLAENRLPGP